MRELCRVLCVEDDPDIRMILEFSLGQMGGYTVLACASGFQALEEVSGFAPQLVLLDVMMPKMSGPETLTRLRALQCMQGVPVVFVTARALPEEVAGLLAHGANGIILKPFDPVTLPQEAHAIWARSHGE
jgi:CheY-like chemotaxis protein